MSVRAILRIYVTCIVVGQGNSTRGPEYLKKRGSVELPSILFGIEGGGGGFPCVTKIHHNGPFPHPFCDLTNL